MHPRHTFHGREFEITALRGWLDDAFAKQGSCVFIEGDSGIGKTSLARRLAVEAETRGARVAWGRCREQAGCPTYWPWIQAFEACGDAAGLAIAEQLASHLDDPESLDTSDPVRARFELHNKASRGLARIARDRAVLILLDDLQWSDAGSLELLEFVARDVPALPVLVVATLRRGFDNRLERLGAFGRVLRLTGLTFNETQAMLEHEIGHANSAEIVQQVQHLTLGNPFFVSEIAQLLRSTPSTAANFATSLPPRAKEILARRVASMPSASLHALQTAAVFGIEFGLVPLARALAETPTETRSRLEAALAAEIVQLLPGALQRYAFSHALMRDALYEGLTAVERANRHLAAARALESGADTEASDYLFDLSHHYFEAARIGDPSPAIRHACNAGEHALQRVAFDQAHVQFGRALAAIEHAVDVAPEERVRALIGYAIACRWTDGDEDSAPFLHKGIACARALDSTLFAETVLRVALQRADFQVLDIETNDLLREALRVIPEAPSSLRARLLARLSMGLHLQPGTQSEQLEMTRTAIAMARGLEDPTTLSLVRSRCLSTFLTPDHAQERAQTVAEILGDPRTTPAVELEARLFQLHDLAQIADRPGLDAAVAIFDQKVRASGSPYFLWQVAINRVAVALLEGRFSEAETLATAALKAGQHVAPQSARIRFAAQLFWLRGWQGRLHEVAPLVEASVEKTQLVPAWRCALAGLYSHAGRDAEARREFDALAANDFRDLPRDSTWLVGMALLADVCVRLGDRERAVLLYDQLEPYAGQIAVATPLIVLNSLFDIRLGSLAGLLGRDEAAIAHHERAIATAERMRALPWQAEARYHLALAHAQAGRREDALEILTQAEAIARPVGMSMLTGWIIEARADVQQMQARAVVATGTGGRSREVGSNVVRLPTTRPISHAAAFRREGDVWTLSFEGRSSRFKDMRGFAHLARLLAEPGREFHAGDLAGASATAKIGDAGEKLDARARAAYEGRLRDLREDLEDAERNNDLGRIERRSQEIEWLAVELSRGIGLGGRERRDASASERARQSVTRAIKYAIDKIETHDPVLADHLRRNIRTGTFCSYSPSPRDTFAWTL